MASNVVTSPDFTPAFVDEVQKCSDAIQVLDFDRDDAHNVTISLRGKNRTLRYIVQSNVQATTTRVTKSIDGGDPTLVGVVQRRSVLPDTISLGDVTLKVGKWLKTPLLGSLPATLTMDKGSFTWRHLGSNHIGLFSDNMASPMDGTPVVSWERSCVQLTNGQNVLQYPGIYMSREAEYIMDEVVLSVIITEHRLRSVERADESKRIAKATPLGATGPLTGGPMMFVKS